MGESFPSSLKIPNPKPQTPFLPDSPPVLPSRSLRPDTLLLITDHQQPSGDNTRTEFRHIPVVLWKVNSDCTPMGLIGFGSGPPTTTRSDPTVARLVWFNPGSQMAADATDIARIAVTTNIAAAMGAIGAMLMAWIVLRKPDASMALNGALAGLVGITAGCASVSPAGAAIIGGIAGLIIVASVLFLDRIGVDDPVGAISVHGICGALGTILLGFFDTSSGVFYA